MVAQTKMWTKPELIVLVRGKPDEAVLDYCKQTGGTGGAGSAGNDAAGCIQPAPSVCQVCQLSNTS
jgi:hypothetical protein